MVRVNVTWGKETFQNVEIDTEQAPLVFKTQLFTLSGVPPEKQKVTIKGKLLNDDNWNNIKLKEGQKLLLIGSAEREIILKKPEEETTFMEDLPEEKQGNVEFVRYGCGLSNLGNTCYMNSTLQCLNAIPELKNKLINYRDSHNIRDELGLNGVLTIELGDLFKKMKESYSSIDPISFLVILRRKFPQFAEKERGFFRQQDAEECWTQLIQALKTTIKNDVKDEDEFIFTVQELFEIVFETEHYCEESDERIHSRNSELKLKCNIPQEPPVNHLIEGIREGLKEDRSQTSDKLQKEVLFKGESKIDRLPPYLNIQMMRFFFKKEVMVKTKILKKIAFPSVLDVYEYCTDKLKAKLDGPRKKMQELKDEELGLKKAESSQEEQLNEQKDNDEQVQLTNTSEIIENKEKTHLLTGVYDLLSIITHKGRRLDAGHYEAWIKVDKDKWLEFDDDKLSFKKEDEILCLSGGGDWHMAYLLVYKARTIEMD